MNRAVVLLSGGLDSAVTAWEARRKGYNIFALTIGYGQAHDKELICARNLGIELGVVEHKFLTLPLNEIGGSALFEKDEIPTGGVGSGVAPTWVPQRNAIFLTIGFGWAEVIGAEMVYIGVNDVDFSGYPDCRPAFISSLERSLNLASKNHVETGNMIWIGVPIIKMSKADIVRMGEGMRVPFGMTWSCYKGDEKACGICDSCRIRLDAFRKAGLEDPIEYTYR